MVKIFPKNPRSRSRSGWHPKTKKERKKERKRKKRKHEWKNERM